MSYIPLDEETSTEDTNEKNIPKLIKYSDIAFLKIIGFGAFGEVFKGTYQNQEVAIKKLLITNFEEKDKIAFQREINVLVSCHHDFLLPFVGYTNSPPYCILTKFIPGGSLYSNLHESETPLTPTQLTIIAYGIASGMKFLHDSGIIHRDLKTQNILLYPNKLPVICDFGSSRQIESGVVMTGQVGTPQYMAPEFLTSQSYNASIDVYSYGVILWEMATYEKPYDGLQPIQIIYQVLSKQNNLQVPDEINHPLAELIMKCLSYEPESRPTFSSILYLFEHNKLHFDGTNFAEVQKVIDNNKNKKKNSESKSKKKQARKTFDFKQTFKNTIKHFHNPSKIASLSPKEDDNTNIIEDDYTVTLHSSGFEIIETIPKKSQSDIKNDIKEDKKLSNNLNPPLDSKEDKVQIKVITQFKMIKIFKTIKIFRAIKMKLKLKKIQNRVKSQNISSQNLLFPSVFRIKIRMNYQQL